MVTFQSRAFCHVQILMENYMLKRLLFIFLQFGITKIILNLPESKDLSCNKIKNNFAEVEYIFEYLDN